MGITNVLANCALILALGAGAQLCHGDEFPVVDFTGGVASTISGDSVTVGFSIIVTTSTVINGLGVFDVGPNGLFDSHQVGIWNGSGTLLVSVTVDNTSNVVPSSSFGGDWREVNISPLSLTPGTYFLGAFFRDANLTPDEDEFVLEASTITSIPGVAFGVPTIASGFADPLIPVVGANGFFGPTAFITPEPGSILLLLTAIVAVGLVVGKNRRERSASAIES